MAGYLLPIFTEIPAGLNCEELANVVYERLKLPDALNDLSLPDPTEYPWAPATPSIRVKFQSKEWDSIPKSNTRADYESGEILCNMVFRRVDVEQCPEFIQSQFVKQITKAIRRVVVKSTVLLHNISTNKFDYTVAEKHPRDRVFKSRFLYKMNLSRDNFFHAGCWMEHNLFGGIIEGLSGSFFTDRNNIEGSRFQTTRNNYVFVKVIATNRFRMVAFDLEHFKYMGYVYDNNAHTFGPKEEIFHSPSAIYCGGVVEDY